MSSIVGQKVYIVIDVENVKIQGVYSSRSKAEMQTRADVGTHIAEWIVR
jgi:hypothetical protein